MKRIDDNLYDDFDWSLDWDVKKIEQIIKPHGANIRNSDGTFKNYRDIIFEISRVWKEL